MIKIQLKLIKCSELRAQFETVLLSGGHYSRFLILSNSLLKEISLAFNGDEIHPFEGVLDVVELRSSQDCKESISNKLDVLAHLLRVDSY